MTWTSGRTMSREVRKTGRARNSRKGKVKINEPVPRREKRIVEGWCSFFLMRLTGKRMRARGRKISQKMVGYFDEKYLIHRHRFLRLLLSFFLLRFFGSHAFLLLRWLEWRMATLVGVFATSVCHPGGMHFLKDILCGISFFPVFSRLDSGFWIFCDEHVF